HHIDGIPHDIELDPDTFETSRHNPFAVLKAVTPEQVDGSSLAQDIDTAYETLNTYLITPSRFSDAPRTSYFCMEYGLHESLPTYSGGLGILAGDHAKAASDLGLPFTAIGLYLKEGYFQQHFTPDGWQLDKHPVLNSENHPFELVTDADGQTLHVTVHMGDQPALLQAWRLRLGRTTLFLLDSDVDGNPDHLRDLTKRLYQGDRRTRLHQEIILGIGGIRLLRALEIPTDVYHINEGHCAFLTFELLRERLAAGDSRDEAESWVREHCVFTTHTPVLAGHDRFVPDLLLDQMSTMRRDLGYDEHDLLAYGRVYSEHHDESFTMTVLGLRLSRTANGVSRLNGEVAREQWQSMFTDRPVQDVPIGSITNGVHVPTWTVPIARAFLNERLGDWKSSVDDPQFWARIDDVPDEVLWQYRNELRAQLLRFASDHVAGQSLPMVCDLNPDALTIGFARRFATYKRAPLLFSDVERVASIFSREDRPVQILYAGKAHPADDGGKRYIQQIVEAAHHPGLRGRVVFLENYNIEIGRMLISGCDVWLNNPRRPMEASGTSGQKVAVHGGLNLSVLDGWWPEGYNGLNGWAIGKEHVDTALDTLEQDRLDAESLYRRLEEAVVPAFYDRDERGIPTLWIRRMRAAMKELVPQFSARRMVGDYVERMYAPAEDAVPLAGER
ncbi:MAG: alpha-glucan family phosphorylase, partial [Rhodothermales bacterium]